MPNNMRTDLPFSTDIPAFETTEPNHASRFNERGNQLASNDAYLKSEQDKIKEKLQEGLPAKGGNADTVDECHAGNQAGDVLKIGSNGKVPENNLIQAIKRWWKPSLQYVAGDVVEPLAFKGNFRAICVTAGQSSTMEPIWDFSDGAAVQDGSVTWKVIDLRNAERVGGHEPGTSAGNVLVLSSGAKVPHAVLDFIQNSRILEPFLNGAAKRWWKPTANYVVGNVIEPIGALNGQVYKCIQAGTSGSAEPAWPTGDYSEFIDGTVKWRTLSLESQSGSVGDLRFPAIDVKPNEIKLNGALLLRANYPELWAWAQSKGYVDSEANWNSYRSGGFSSGDGSTTFRIPDIRGLFLRISDEGKGNDDWNDRIWGCVQGDAMRNFSGGIDATYADGIFRYGWQAGTVQGESSAPVHRYIWEAANLVPTSPEFRPKNVNYYAVIRYK